MKQLAFPASGRPPPDAADRDSLCTPPWLWRLALAAENRERFDLDPCSNEWSTVPAAARIALPADGLALPWAGCIWLNPPYSDVRPWFDRAAQARETGARVWGVVPLAPGLRAWRASGPDFVWPLGRVAFASPASGVGSGLQDHSLVLWANTGRAPRVEHPRVQYLAVRVEP